MPLDLSLYEGAPEWSYGGYIKQNYPHICAAKPLPQSDGIRFLFGCETEMTKDFKVGVAKEHFERFDFVVIPVTYFHMTDFTIPGEYTRPKQKADFWLKKLNALLDMDLPFHKIGAAHLTCGLMDADREKYLELIDSLDADAMAKVFAKAAKTGIGIELNSDDMNFAETERDTVLRPYRIAKEAGCKFYCGSDAHHPQTLDRAKGIFERTIDYLELTEEDKFKI